MKLLRLADLIVALVLFALAVPAFGWVGAFLFVFALGALTAAPGRGGRLCVVTLILPRILQRLMDAYKRKLPLLKYFSFDVSPEKVKFEQPIIAQMPIIPTATSHVPGADLTIGAQNVKDLLTDVPMAIDQARKVVIKIPTADAVRLELDPAFNMVVENAGFALAEGVVGAALSTISTANFTHSFVEAPADFDRDTLSKARTLLNQQKASAPRFGITSLDAMSTLTADPRIASRDYHAKLVDDNPYVTLENLEGFKEITEFSGFPADGPVGVFTADPATDLLTLSLHGLPDGSRVRVSNAGGALPTGLAAGTNYFVLYQTADTFKLSATLGGAPIDLTSAGTGTQTVNRFENLEALFFDPRAILIGIRQLNDNIDFAKKLGIPVPILSESHTDPDTGLTFTAYMWIHPTTHDIFVACVVAFGVRGGRQGGTNAADTYFDRSALRVTTA